MRCLCLTLCLLALAGGAASAQDSRAAAMSSDEDAALSARAAQSPELEGFSGGAWAGVSDEAAVVFIVIVFGIAALIYLLWLLVNG